jgi:hypothetical protein
MLVVYLRNNIPKDKNSEAKIQKQKFRNLNLRKKPGLEEGQQVEVLLLGFSSFHSSAATGDRGRSPGKKFAGSKNLVTGYATFTTVSLVQHNCTTPSPSISYKCPYIHFKSFARLENAPSFFPCTCFLIRAILNTSFRIPPLFLKQPIH